MSAMSARPAYFNPLPRKEGDVGQQVNHSALRNFNPLPRKEGDLPVLPGSQTQPISIHSLVKRETLQKRCRLTRLCKFQSTPS